MACGVDGAAAAAAAAVEASALGDISPQGGGAPRKEVGRKEAEAEGPGSN